MNTEIEESEAMFTMKTARTYDHTKIVPAVAAFNRVLERAARAIIADLGETPDALKYLEEWKPATPTDTWFGPHPGKFIQHLLQTGQLHRGPLPDQSALH